MGRHRDGPITQAHDSLGPIEAGTRNTRAGDPESATEIEPGLPDFLAGAGVKRRRFGGEEASGERPIDVGVLEATWAVEATVVARDAFRLGNELTR